ncbi:ribonuclease H2 subunit B isoform X1 [Podarcis raffonei]|uniref:ribonuclease H2 subunit B isoform X1 n=1 Tax=Podarcis raffonei TaxID=65483 RepID=UPI00232963C5|nr:ribonuclease H2 subunit B isoform X1 [Podarcis raffonei]
MPAGRQRVLEASAGNGGGGGQWVIVAPESATNLPKKPGSEPLFTKLRNPSTGQAALYLFGSDGRQVFEVKAFHEEYRSWFIGEAVQHDGRLLFATPVDPLFLLLFYLTKAEKEQGKFQPLDQFLVDEEFSSCAVLLNCKNVSQSVHHLVDEKEIGGRKFYKYSEEKTLKWLKKKVDQTVKVLKDNDIPVGGKVQSATFISGKRNTDATEEDYIRYAHGLITEYISEELSTALAQYLRLPQIASPPAEPASKKRKLSDAPVEAEEDYTKFNTSDLKSKKANSKMSAAQKALAKVDKSGMKTMSSFFSSKTKTTK